MIQIKMHDYAWRIKITDEKWEFENRNQLNETLKELLNFKETFGKIND